MRPTRVLWTLVLVALCAVLGSPLTRRGATPTVLVESLGLPWLVRQPAARAERVGTAWAWAAAAECLPPGSAAQWGAFERALALDPLDESTLVRRAACFTHSSGVRGRWPRERAATAIYDLVAAHPDNAVGYYLLATQERRTGHWDQAVEAVCLGNAAPRLELAYASSVARFDRFTGRRARSPWTTPVALTGVVPWQQLLPAEDGPALSPPAALALARCAARLREHGTSPASVWAGVRLQAAVFATLAAGATRYCPPDDHEHQLAAAREADRRLGAAGWAEAETRRGWRVAERLRRALGDDQPARGCGHRALVWYLAAWALWTAALAVLVGLLPPRRDRAPDVGWRELARWVALPAAVSLLCAGLLPYALCDGRLPGALLAFVGASLLPGLLARRALALDARRVRTHGLGSERVLWQQVASALAALLVLAALSTSLPAGQATRALLIPAMERYEQAALTNARR